MVGVGVVCRAQKFGHGDGDRGVTQRDGGAARCDFSTIRERRRVVEIGEPVELTSQQRCGFDIGVRR